jgi:hypothetical protein
MKYLIIYFFKPKTKKKKFDSENRENGVFAIFVSCSKKEKIHGFSHRQRSCSNKCRQNGVLGTFSGWMLMKVLKSLP